MKTTSRLVTRVGGLMVALAGVICLRAETAPPAQVAQSDAAAPRMTAPVLGADGAPGKALPQRALLDTYCVTCHNQRLNTGGLALDALDVGSVGEAREIWEKVVLRLRGGSMPPVGRPRPDAQSYGEFRSWLEDELDRAASSRPNPGRVPVHRLNRAEYANAIRDLLGIEIDAEPLLPADDTSYGFDNIAGGLTLSPALLERYMSAARRISRLAVGDLTISPGLTSKTYNVPLNLVQADRMSDELPFGSRGGVLIRHQFPLDGEYVIHVRLKRNVYEFIVNIDERHELDIRLDDRRLARLSVGGEATGTPAPATFAGTFTTAGGLGYPTQEWEDYRISADQGLTVRFNATAGTRAVGISFLAKTWELEGVLQPPLREYAATVTETTDRVSRPEGPDVESVTIEGPYHATGAGETASRAKIFTCHPRNVANEARCAKTILGRLARRAFRRPVSDADLKPLLAFYEQGRSARDFEAGIQRAIERMLVDPEFLFRLEHDRRDAQPGAIHALSDVELASRLSFFLWSSIPDDELLDLAERGRLSEPATSERQVRRMLADGRSKALVQNFFGQWLSLRSLRGSAPDPNIFPDFDENLRSALQQETGLFVESQLREDRSVLDLLRADYTFLNERLARHYGIPNVVGNHFRRVTLAGIERRGLLGHGSVLTVTSYGNRTSPVLRAKWILENMLGTPPPAPPPDVPPFPEETGEDGEPRSVRQRLSQHRTNPACASCHAPMDPLGFALENFDATGRWRTIDAHAPIDASGSLVDGTQFNGPDGLRRVLLDRHDQFVHTVAEKLLTYALGRGLEYHDMPVVRGIARAVAPADYRWSSLILQIVNSVPFRMTIAS